VSGRWGVVAAGGRVLPDRRLADTPAAQIARVSAVPCLLPKARGGGLAHTSMQASVEADVDTLLIGDPAGTGSGWKEWARCCGTPDRVLGLRLDSGSRA
jgi:hypothetical protein